ncbi:MAG: S9 family peptidase [Vulcanimicrobiaceae bacterium]
MNQPAIIPRRVLLGNPDKAGPQISPDGTMLAYLAPSDGVLSVWVRTIGRTDDRVVARDPARPIMTMVWQGDSRHVLYLQDAAGNENYHLFQVASDGGAARELTDGAQTRAGGGILAIDHRYPNQILIGSNQRDPTVFDAYRVDLVSGQAVLDTQNPGNVLAWRNDTQFVVRAGTVQNGDGSSHIIVRDDASSAWRTLDDFSALDGRPRTIAFSPDGTQLYVITAKDANAERLVRYDLATGSAVPIADDPAYDVASVYIDRATKEPIAVAILRDRLEWTTLASGYEADFAALRELHAGEFHILDASADGNVLIVRYVVDDGSAAFFSYDRVARAGTFLFDEQAELADYTLAKMSPIVFAARDGLTIHGYLTLPAGVERGPLPTVLYVHGGPWYRDRWGYEPIVQWLANRGYAVLQVNFRGSTGYGKAFLNAGNREWAGAMRTDLLDARDWAVAQGVSDPKRFGILGGSYGGYAVLAALAFTPDAFTCGVDIVGVSNLSTFIDSIPAYWKPMLAMLRQRVGDDPAFLAAQSPITFAADIRAPLLIGQGANDPRVRQNESDQIVAAMRRNRIPVTYVLFEDEGHGFANPANNMRFFAAAETFLGEALGGRMQPPEPDEDIRPFLR